MKEIIIKYIFASIFVFCIVSAEAQQNSLSTQIPHQKALRFGVDLISVVTSAINPDEMMLNFHSDFHYKTNIYLAADGGFINIFRDESNLNYNSKGFYMSLGADKSLMGDENQNDLDIFYIGARYGIALYEHAVDSIQIDNYWGEYNGTYSSDKLNTHWVEFILGTKVELFFARNFFFGAIVRYRMKLFSKEDLQMTPYLIPGFGKGDKSSQIAVNWSLYYRIPFKN